MMASAEQPLYGCTILLTRPAASGAQLCERLESLGAVVETRPTIALEPPRERAPVLHALASLESFDWLLFTSPRGVHFFFSLMHETRGSMPELQASIGSVGPSTSRALRERGLPPDVEAKESRAEGLVEALLGRIRANDRILVVRPEISRPLLADSLRAMGADVLSVPFYRNVGAPGVEDVARDICNDRYEIIILTSPSTLERLFEGAEAARLEIERPLARSAIVTIGAVTARAAEEAGLSVAAVAERPTVEGIADAVLKLFEE
jgi:uroporphyrinogen-III synthase